MKTLEKLNESQRSQLKKGVIEVRGKAMNRTALGVVAAIFELYPNITYNELKIILPDKINPSAPKNFKSIFKPFTEKDYGVVQLSSIEKEIENNGFKLSDTHFILPEERFITSDGKEIVVSKLWESEDSTTGENDLQNLINHVKDYGIRVVKFEKKENFNKGEYHIEIINPILFKNLITPQKNNKKILFIIISLIILLLFFFLYFYNGINDNNNNNDNDDSINSFSKNEIIESVINDSTSLNQIKRLKNDIEAGIQTEDRSISFHDILFEYNSDQILKESEIYLDEVYNLLNEIKNLELLIVGHTSNEGTVEYNLKLSENRALSVKKYLTYKGIEESRLSVKGEGIENPVDSNETEEGREKNRRIEFVVLNDGN